MAFITGITRLGAIAARAASTAGRAGAATVKAGAQDGLRRATANVVAGAVTGITQKKSDSPDEDQAYR